MRHRIALALILSFALLAVTAPVASGLDVLDLRGSEDGCFSTEEDFVTQGPEPADGNPIISDGDLLSLKGALIARNAQLLQAFYAAAPPPEDLGLDAIDVIDVESSLAAFSTSLGDPGGRFGAGDLLFTNGGIIPNEALGDAFGISYDIGLDAVHLVGDSDDLVAFAAWVLNQKEEAWPQGRLATELDRMQIDLWFSIEGTYSVPGAAMILDGDLLSALGTIVAAQDVLLPASVPAGLPNRGVDFGLDAASALEGVTDVPPIYFSTEILYRGDEMAFTDGDLLLGGNGVVIADKDIVAPFEPRADFLGLDAFDLPVQEQDPEPEPMITHIGQVAVTDIDGGNVSVGGTGTGLGMDSGYERPYGRYVPIYGEAPSPITEYRVAYRVAGSARPIDPATANGIAVVSSVGWRAEEWNWATLDCSGWEPVSSDADGWFDAVEYRRLANGDGMPHDCTAQLALTVWDSNSAAVDTEGHYVIWLQWRVGAGPIQEEAVDHHIQFDNQPPDALDMSIPGGACTAYGPGDMPIMVQAHADDPHFWFYRLRVFGGNPPSAKNYANVYYDDATPAAANIGATGTGAGLVDLHEVNVNDLPAASIVDCCYGVRLWVEDRTMIGGFDPPYNNVPLSYGFHDTIEITFAYTP